METGPRPDILYLAHRVPYPPDKGDRIRTYHILRFLAAHANVHLACLADEPVSEDTVAALAGFCKRLAIVPLGGSSRWGRALGSFLCGQTITAGAFSSPGLRAAVRAWARTTPFQTVLGSASSMAPYLNLLELQNTPAVVDVMDVDSQKWFDYAAAKPWPRSWLYRIEGRRLRRLEESLARRGRVLTVSSPEADLFRSFCPSADIDAITNGVDLSYFQQSTEVAPEQGLVFVGALDYFPNIDAAIWFCREVWPEVQRRRPEARFRLVGRKPAPAVLRLSGIAGVELLGTVADVRPHLARAAVVVIPLRIARGLQNKVLEAMAMGKPVVASPCALAALHTQPGVHLLTASSPEEWIGAISQLLDNEPLRRTLGQAGRQYVEERHDWNVCLAPLLEILGRPRRGQATAATLASGKEYPLERGKEERRQPAIRAEKLSGALSCKHTVSAGLQELPGSCFAEPRHAGTFNPKGI
jgi:sugar transferase (PEP-CTERM/EpsH1 system associated)